MPSPAWSISSCKDYVGAEARATYGAPTRSGGGKTWDASAFAGFGDPGKDRFNVTSAQGTKRSIPSSVPTGRSRATSTWASATISPFFIGNANSGTACRFENSPFLSVQSGLARSTSWTFHPERRR
jgi:hypothetical protein